jgi:hypothetical protein
VQAATKGITSCARYLDGLHNDACDGGAGLPLGHDAVHLGQAPLFLRPGVVPTVHSNGQSVFLLTTIENIFDGLACLRPIFVRRSNVASSR